MPITTGLDSSHYQTGLFQILQTSPEIIRLAVMLYIRFPLSLRNVEDLLYEHGIDVSHESVRYWWHRFGPMFASEPRALAPYWDSNPLIGRGPHGLRGT